MYHNKFHTVYLLLLLLHTAILSVEGKVCVQQQPPGAYPIYRYAGTRELPSVKMKTIRDYFVLVSA